MGAFFGGVIGGAIGAAAAAITGGNIVGGFVSGAVAGAAIGSGTSILAAIVIGAASGAAGNVATAATDKDVDWDLIPFTRDVLLGAATGSLGPLFGKAAGAAAKGALGAGVGRGLGGSIDDLVPHAGRPGGGFKPPAKPQVSGPATGSGQPALRGSANHPGVYDPIRLRGTIRAGRPSDAAFGSGKLRRKLAPTYTMRRM